MSIDRVTLQRIIAQTRDALDSAPSELRAGLLDVLGNARFRLGDHREALKWFRLLAAENPEYADPLSNVACCLIEVGDFAAALKAFGQARKKPIKEEGQDLRIWANEAEAHFKLGDVTASRRAFAEAARLASTEYPHGFLVLAAQAAAIGAEDDAVEFLARYVAVDQGLTLGDHPPLEILQSAPKTLLERIAELPDLADALKNVRDREGAVAPPEHQVRNDVQLDERGWQRLTELVDLS
ncbi:MAG TPA: hypothetical protein VGH20_05170 [Myxococcales bacterium]